MSKPGGGGSWAIRDWMQAAQDLRDRAPCGVEVAQT